MTDGPSREKLALKGELAANQDQLERLLLNICEIERALFVPAPETKSSEPIEASSTVEGIIADNRRVINRSVSLTESILSRLT